MYTWAEGTRYNGERATKYVTAHTPVEVYYVGGTAAWRNNNPGNLCYNTFADAKGRGAIGQDHDHTPAYAIFPNDSKGYEALKYCVLSTYRNLTLENCMYNFAPRNENDTESYIQFLAKKIGVSRYTVINNMSNDQQIKLVDGIKAYEGTQAGQIISVGTQP